MAERHRGLVIRAVIVGAWPGDMHGLLKRDGAVQTQLGDIVAEDGRPDGRAMALVAGVVGGSTASTKPLDGHDLWAALNAGDPAASPRTDVYYGLTDSAAGVRVSPAHRPIASPAGTTLT